MTYRDYVKQNLTNVTDEKIERQVGGLFGADTEMDDPIEHGDTYTKYDMGSGYMLYSNNSTFDTVELIDENSNVLESWFLEY